MENEVVQPNSAPADVDLPLGDYRALREGRTAAAKPEAKPETKPEAKAAVASVALEPGDPSVEEPGEEDNPEQRKKKLGGFQKKIARQEQELAELRKRLQTSGQPTPAATPETPAAAAPPLAVFGKPKPTLEDSDGIEDYAEKLTDWKLEERAWRDEQKTTAAKQADAAKTLVAGWNTRKTAFVAEHDDWDDAMDAVKDIKLSPAHQQIFLESENGPELAYLLANDRDELERIAKLPPLAAAREIGKLETRFAKVDADEPEAPAKPEIKVSKAPPPFKPVSGSNGRGTPNVANMDLADYRKARESGRL